MRRAISFILALVFCFSLACSVSATTNSPAQGGTAPSISNNKWQQGSNSGLSMTVKGMSGKVESVKINNATLNGSYYTVTANSNGAYVITLSQAYLSTLSVGTHTITIMTSEGAQTFTFTVSSSGTSTSTIVYENPKTGDTAHMELWVPMMVCSALALAAVVFVYFKKFAR